MTFVYDHSRSESDWLKLNVLPYINKDQEVIRHVEAGTIIYMSRTMYE
jgi:hypothetical protein